MRAFDLIEVVVFPLDVEELFAEWPEMNERKRNWFTTDAAEHLVGEPGLISILRLLRSKQ